MGPLRRPFLTNLFYDFEIRADKNYAGCGFKTGFLRTNLSSDGCILDKNRLNIHKVKGM